MRAQEVNIDVISNNIANVNTTSYKKGRANFQDLIYQAVVEPGAPTSQNTTNSAGIQIGLGVRTVSVDKSFDQGDVISTNNPLDIAIEGDGFFQIARPDGGIFFSRSGNFTLNAQGLLVTQEGYSLEPAITIPPDAVAITIGEDGTVSVKQPGQAQLAQVGQITGVRFPNRTGLKAVGKNLYQETPSSGQPQQGIFGEQGFGVMAQGFLESSNVSVVEQVVTMITAQRAYEANSKGIQTSDDMLSQAINLKR
jgi:flagellar basal-body rod protein FlgG